MTWDLDMWLGWLLFAHLIAGAGLGLLHRWHPGLAAVGLYLVLASAVAVNLWLWQR